MDAKPMRVVKLLLIGNSEAGKSSLLLSYSERRFLDPGHSVATVGVDFRSFRKVFDGTTYKVCIWDTAGQERFRAVTKSFYRDAAVVFIVFDVANKASFESLGSWLNEVLQNCSESVTKVLVANKIDLVGKPNAVQISDAIAYAASHGLSYREVSAKTMAGVQELFDEFAEKAFIAPPLPPGQSSGNISVSPSRLTDDASSPLNSCSC